jgi:tetratricopeptide (TPR) repeat protein
MLRLLLRTLFIFSVAVGIYSCSRPPQELKTAESLIETTPDSALHILQHLSPDKYRSGESRALYGLLMIRTLDKKLLPLKPESLLDYSISYYEQNPESDRLSSCYFYKGRTYKYSFQYEKATIFYLKALDEAKDSKNNLLLGRINFDMGDIYNIQRDFVAARKKFYLAYTFLRKSNSKPQTFYSLLYIGRTYHECKDYKKAEAFYRQLLPLAKDSLLKAALCQEIGLNFYDYRKLDSALVYYREIVKYPYVGNNRAIRYNTLAKIYFDLNKPDSSFLYASESFRFNPDIRTQRESFRIMANCDFAKGRINNVTTYMNKYVQIGDSLRKVDGQIKGSYMETMHSTKKEANENKVQKWISWGAIFLAIVGFLYLIRRIFIKVRKEKKELLEVHTEEKVGIHKKVIEDKRAILQKQIEDRKKNMLIEFKNAGSQEREFQLRKIYKELIHFDEPELFFKEMDKFLNRLITKLKKQYGTLNEKELMLCCYLLLHIPTYDMLILFGYKSDDSLKSLKKRLPKKLNLENATVLEDFLLAILSEN